MLRDAIVHVGGEVLLGNLKHGSAGAEWAKVTGAIVTQPTEERLGKAEATSGDAGATGAAASDMSATGSASASSSGSVSATTRVEGPSGSATPEGEEAPRKRSLPMSSLCNLDANQNGNAHWQWTSRGGCK